MATATAIAQGGNGGTGNLVGTTISVSPGQTITIVVGSGGSAGANKASTSTGSATSGRAGGSSSAGGVSASGGGGGGGGVVRYKDDYTHGSNGTSYSGGGAGGAAGSGSKYSQVAPTAGSPGWVYIEYGGDI